MSYRSKVAVVYLLGFFIDLITMFIANVAYPAIAHSLGASVAGLAWVSNGYIMGLTLAIPLSAWLTQRAGARRVFLLSLALFTLACAAAGFAGSLSALVFWRVVQGAGGGLLIPVGQALAWRLYAPHERAKIASAVMLVGLLAPALSPAAGGLLITALGWRGVFFASLPLALATLALAWRWLRREAPADRSAPPDAAGLALGCGALFLLLFGLTRLSDSHATGLAALLLLAGGTLLALFARRCRKRAAPALNLNLLADPLLRFSMAVYQAVPGVFIGINLVAMLWLQNSLGLTPGAAGMLMMPWSLGSFLAICLTGKTFNALGPEPLIMAGCLLQALGIALLTQIERGEQQLALAGAFALMGVGGSLCSSAAQSSAFLNTPNAALPDAAALWNINRQLSFCFGVALFTLLLDQFCAHVAPAQAYRWTFWCAALATLLPLPLCFRLDNRAVKLRLVPEQETL